MLWQLYGIFHKHHKSVMKPLGNYIVVLLAQLVNIPSVLHGDNRDIDLQFTFIITEQSILFYHRANIFKQLFVKHLIADAVHSAVESQCGEQGEVFSLTKNQLIKLLADEKILVKMSGRNTGSVRLNGSRTMNVVTLDKKAIEKRLYGGVCPPTDEVGQVSE